MLEKEFRAAHVQLDESINNLEAASRITKDVLIIGLVFEIMRMIGQDET
jgi:hypothetical protein